MPPLIKTFLEDGLAYLLGARGSHTARGLVKFQALGFEWKAAEFEDPSHTAFEILDHVPVLDSQDLPREHCVPVLHELHVTSVVAADILETVGELLARREELLEVAEAAGHRRASRVDDLCIREDQVNEANMPEVVRKRVA